MKIFPIIILAAAVLLSTCSPRIAGYTKGGCINDPATNTCRPVCSWKLNYRLEDKTDCMRAKYGCPRDERLFSTWQGCGCAKPVFCPSR